MIVSFSGAYINYSTLVGTNYFEYASEKVFNIGVRNEHELFNNFNLFYDASYISPAKEYKKSFPYFPLGYASYDFGLSYKIGYVKLSYKHNCTHRFITGKLFIFWNDLSSDTFEIEIDF